MITSRPRLSHRAATLALFAAMASQAAAQTSGSWGAAASGNWSDTANWTSGTVASGDAGTATFSQNWTGQTVTVDTDFTIGRILAADTTVNGGLLISGPGGLTLANGINKPVIDTGTNTNFSEPGGTSPFNNPLRITAVLAGTNGFEKTGAGYLSLEAANTFSGNIKLTAPAAGGGNFLRLTNDNNLGDVGNDIEVAANAQAVGLYASTGFNVVLNSGRNITTSSASGTQDFWIKTKGTGNITVEGIISGGTRLRKNDSGTATLTGANTFSGNTFIEGGTLVLSGGDNRLASGGTVTMGNATSGVTLQIDGGTQNLNGLVLTSPTAAVTQTIRGTGTLVLGGTGDYTINSAFTTTSVDMSGLSNFTYNRTASSFQLNANAASVVNSVNLAKAGTNEINATNVRFGGGGNFAGQNVLIGLGQNNKVHASGEFVIGYFQGNGDVSFQSGLTNPVLTVRGAGGSGATPLMTVGSTNSGNQASTGILNLTGGSLDAIVTNLNVARHFANANTNSTGTITMPAGTVVATTLNIAAKTNTTGTPTLTGTFNQSGGTVTATTVNLGNNESSGAANLIANYNLTGGTLFANSITGSGANFGASTVRNLNLNGGTLRNIAGGDLAISGVNSTATGRLNLIVGASNGTVEADVSRTVSLADTVRLSGSGTITKSGAGTLLINADSSAFTGGLTLADGSLEIGAVDAVSTFNAANFTWNGGTTIHVDLTGASGSDLLNLTGAFTKGTGSSFAFDFGGGGEIGGSYGLGVFASTNFLSGDFAATNLGTGLVGQFVIDGDSLTLNVSAIPEPSAFAVIAGLGAIGAAGLRRRRRAG